jgi:hypothetical protein
MDTQIANNKRKTISRVSPIDHQGSLVVGFPFFPHSQLKHGGGWQSLSAMSICIELSLPSWAHY